MRLPRCLRRTAARALVALGAAAPLTACSFITGVPDVDRVELTVPVATIAPGQQIQAQGLALRGNGSVINHSRRQVSYRSSDEAIVRVAANGVITGIAPGRATVTASSDGKSDEEEITVRPVPVRQLIISPSQPIVRLAPTVTYILATTALDTANQPLGGRTPTWRSLDTTVATIAATGSITPRAVGEARVVASVDTGLAPAAGVVADTVLVRVTLTPIINVRVQPASPTLYVGQQQQFTAVLTDSLQRVVTDRRVVWSTTDGGTSLAIDSVFGLATAVAPAQFGTTVRARVEVVPGAPIPSDIFGSASVPVLAPAASVRITNGGTVTSSLNLTLTGTALLNITALDVRGNALSGRTFAPPGNTATNVVSADYSQGAGTLFLRAQGVAGTATITIQTLDAAGNPQGTSATVTVTVAP